MTWLQNICVTKDHGYLSFVVITIGHFLIHDLSPVCKKGNTMGATCGAGTDHPSRAPELTPSF